MLENCFCLNPNLFFRHANNKNFLDKKSLILVLQSFPSVNNKSQFPSHMSTHSTPSFTRLYSAWWVSQATMVVVVKFIENSPRCATAWAVKLFLFVICFSPHLLNYSIYILIKDLLQSCIKNSFPISPSRPAINIIRKKNRKEKIQIFLLHASIRTDISHKKVFPPIEFFFSSQSFTSKWNAAEFS